MSVKGLNKIKIFSLPRFSLSDTKPLKDYGVEDSCKITLVIKKSVVKPSDSPNLASSQNTCPAEPQNSCPVETERPVWEKLRVFLRRHFRERDVEAVLQEFRKV